MRRVPVLLALVLLALVPACSEPSPRSSDKGTGRATVVRPVDGDTLIVDVDGQEERLRLIGIDTPESVAEDRPVECYGPESKDRTADLLPSGTEVRLERDVEARDKYDRLLAYVTRAEDDVLVNLLLVEEGMAEAQSYPPNTARQAQLEAAEQEARAAGRGLWGACGGTDVPIG